MDIRLEISKWNKWNKYQKISYQSEINVNKHQHLFSWNCLILHASVKKRKTFYIKKISEAEIKKHTESDIRNCLLRIKNNNWQVNENQKKKTGYKL